MILDTHAWIFYATGKVLDRQGLRRIEKARKLGRLQIAAVTLWEAAVLVQERRLRLAVPVAEWLRDALARTDVHVAPLDIPTAIESARWVRTLRDPADCQIVGTAIRAGAALATRDTRILETAETMGLDVVEV